MLVIRMTRQGAKKRPYYHIVVTDSRNPRDGKFIERIGHYNPMLLKEDPKRVGFTEERLKHWLKMGAQPSDRVARFMHAANLGPKVKWNETPKKSAPKAKAQERLKAAAEASEKAAADAAAPAAEAQAPEAASA